MAAGSSSYVDEDEGVIADINVTPLVDITLVLLIVYMITVPSIVSNPAIKVDLPTASSGQEARDTTLTVTIRRDPAGTLGVYANGEPADEEKLKGMVPTLLESNKDLVAVIAADKGIPYGDVVRIVDLVGSLGVGKIALETRLPAGD